MRNSLLQATWVRAAWEAVTVAKDANLSSKLYVTGDASMSSTLYVQNETTLVGAASLNDTLYVTKDASFNSKLCLKRHVQSVHEENNICDICSLGFQSKFILSQHIMSIHEGMTPLKCGFCNASFPSEKRIKRHVEQVHEKRKPFKCDLCKTGYFEKSKLKIHMKSPLHLAAIDKVIENIDKEKNCVEIKEKPKDIYETNRDIVFVMEPDIADKINEDTLEANFSEVWEENHENIDIQLEQLDSAESFDARKFYPLLDQTYEKKNETFNDGLVEYVDLNYESVHDRTKQDVNHCKFNSQGQIVQEKKSLDNKINAVHDYEEVGKIQISLEDTEYKCSLCEFESDNKKATATHVQMVHEEKKHNLIVLHVFLNKEFVQKKMSIDVKCHCNQITLF